MNLFVRKKEKKQKGGREKRRKREDGGREGRKRKKEGKERDPGRYLRAITPVDYIWRYFLCKPVVLS